MEESAFAAFYEDTYRGLWAYVARGVGEPAVAEDIAQEAYVRLLQAVRGGTDVAKAKAYLYRIATNLVIDHGRRRGREVQREETPESPPPEFRPHGDLDLSIDLDGAFTGLDVRQRLLLWLAYVEGYRHRDIGRILGVGESSVRVLLFRARGRFAELLRGMGIDLEDTP